MPKAILLLFTNAEPGRDEEFNDWYDAVHLPEMLALPGMIRGSRFRLSDASPTSSDPSGKYLALYDLETDDLEGMLAELEARAPGMAWSSSLILQGEGAPQGLLYEPI
jgi:hypothetical protein